MTDRIDPARSMALLWGSRDRPNRGPKPGLNVDLIVRTAIGIADAEGMDALSMRRVAEALGVGTMSLYTYIPAKSDLFELMVDAAIGAPPSPEPDGWRPWLERFARDSLAGYRRHPWLLRVSLTRGLMGPNQTAALEAFLRTLSGIGLSAGEMMAVVQVVAGYVRGVAQSAAEDAQVERSTGVTDEQWWSDLAPLLTRYVEPAAFPTLNQVFACPDWVDPFEFGLCRLLDGVEALVAARSA
ncbi:TetR/AcrR family transcriptional regulator [Actinophytocola sp.]|uniref:TetR/AcrR family transcriptional regulator n=1 Tax=Actinophytocola sp. TaxID=1872138 RepID=UPI002D7E9E0F|nr:TetR/AcrR family transcriptional regulator [Actinophytocola sp.]HET9141958.1 TetR/AcrR family transcriptional regulator [Actinophytocola sp.]HEU5108114.1 TetR/AcrR family transcriptional regulator [Micromonosporaceae bacterium]